MCGLIFVKQSAKRLISEKNFKRAIERQSWRGPDAMKMVAYNDGAALIGHNRLAIIDPVPRSDQPMNSICERYVIVFNGEIYNHREIRRNLRLECVTHSDTETILEGYIKIGKEIVSMIDGMFAFVIYDKSTGYWFSARDGMGIKPLYYYQNSDITVIGSEPAPINEMLNLSVDHDSVNEWRIARRPIPGSTYFQGLKEHMPGVWRDSNGKKKNYWLLKKAIEVPFSQSEFDRLLEKSVSEHEMSDVTNVSLLSGGLDSGVITGLSKVKRSYCIGLEGNNEFSGAEDTARKLGKDLVLVNVTEEKMIDTWRYLTNKRGEPLSVPNEALIYLVCKEMREEEKVVLTGEGADELLFGYDEIFRWSLNGEWSGIADFFVRYGYSSARYITDRMIGYIEEMRADKTLNEFVEDFFFEFHLPGLLRRMDFASMAASKEARVPFVDRNLIDYLYRASPSIKIDNDFSKIPLRTKAASMGLHGALERKKIGFSATGGQSMSRIEEYNKFQGVVMGELNWS